MPQLLTPKPDQRQDQTRSGFFQRNRSALLTGIVVVGIGGFLLFEILGQHQAPPPEREAMHMITLPPPVPPPPPPPPPKQLPPTPPEPVAAPKPKDLLEAPKDDAMKATSSKGDSFGLTGTLNGTGQGGGGRFGWYASAVQAAVSDALHHNEKTRNAGLHLKARIWPDAQGKIVRVELSDPTGDKTVDAAIENEVLNGLQLEPPPKDMPRPIVLSITRR